MQPNYDALSKLSKVIKCNGYYVFTVGSQDNDILIHGRMFAPAIGIIEDHVTGNANGPLGEYLIHHNFVKHNNSLFKFKAKQGEAIKRSGIIEVDVKIKIGGRVIMANIDNEMKYDIMYNENSEYDGEFYTAVKTTRVYCKPSCTAKKPNKENCEFYDTITEAEAHGYRPCKICFPNLLQVKWKDYKQYIEIDVPKDFSFKQCMVYLNRSDIECLHRIKDGDFYKLLKFEAICWAIIGQQIIQY